jgi:hypothetical protein
MCIASDLKRIHLRSHLSHCEREIRNLIDNAHPKNFSWDDLLRFVPEEEQIIALTPEYRSRRKHTPVSAIPLLSNSEREHDTFYNHKLLNPHAPERLHCRKGCW